MPVVPTTPILDALPLWVAFLATVGLLLAMSEIGFRIGRWRRSLAELERKTQAGAAAGSMLALLAFMLAFAFGLAGTRFETRKALVVHEANAIGTAALRADFLDPASREAVHRLLREYVAIRLEGIRRQDLVPAMRRTPEIHAQLWSLAVAGAEARPGSPTAALFAESVNQVIDLNGERVAAGLRNRLAPTIWATLYAVAALSMGVMGLHSGLAGSRSLIATATLVIVFAAVLLLVLDLDRPSEGGLFSVSQQASVDLLEAMDRGRPSP